MVLSMPQEKQAWTAIGLWPRRLPKCVRKELGLVVRCQWQALRTARDTRARSLREYRKATRNMIDPGQELTLQLFGYQDRMLAKWYLVAQDLLDRIRSIHTEKIVSVGLMGREDEGYSLHFAPDSTALQHGLYAMTLRLICVSLDKGGVVLVHQRLPPTTPSCGSNDQMGPQECLYGIKCEQGQWTCMSARELRQAGLEAGEAEDLTFGVLTTPVNSGERAL